MNLSDEVFHGTWICQRVWCAGGQWHSLYRSTVDETITYSHFVAPDSPDLPRVGQMLRWVFMTMDE